MTSELTAIHVLDVTVVLRPNARVRTTRGNLQVESLVPRGARTRVDTARQYIRLKHGLFHDQESARNALSHIGLDIAQAHRKGAGAMSALRRRYEAANEKDEWEQEEQRRFVANLNYKRRPWPGTPR